MWKSVLECGEGEGRCGEVGEVKVVGDVWGSTEGGVKKCAGVWGRCGKVFRKVRKSLGGWGQRSWVREVGVGGLGSGVLKSGGWGRGC